MALTITACDQSGPAAEPRAPWAPVPASSLPDDPLTTRYRALLSDHDEILAQMQRARRTAPEAWHFIDAARDHLDEAARLLSTRPTSGTERARQQRQEIDDLLEAAEQELQEARARIAS